MIATFKLIYVDFFEQKKFVFYSGQNFLFPFFPTNHLDPILHNNFFTDCFREIYRAYLIVLWIFPSLKRAQTKHAFIISYFHSLLCYHVSTEWKWFWKLTWRNNLFHISRVHCISLVCMIFPTLSWPTETLKAQKKSGSPPEHFYNKVKYQVLYFIYLLVVVNVGYQIDSI